MREEVGRAWRGDVPSIIEVEQKDHTKILYGSKSVIALIKDPMFHGRRKYISSSFIKQENSYKMRKSNFNFID